MEPKIKILIITGIIAVIIGITVFLVRQNKKNSPVDCVANEWTNWSSCSVNCGGGTQTRTRTIKTSQKNGGKCDVNLSETRDCNTQDCPVNCEVITSSSPCIEVNGVFKKKITKTIKTPARNGGTPCPPDSELKEEEKICPFLIPNSAVPSVTSIWSGNGEYQATYDGNYGEGANVWNPSNGVSTWIVFKYDNPVNIEGIKMRFNTGELPISSNDPQILRIYKNVDQSPTTQIKTGLDLSNYQFPSNNLILENTFTEGRRYINISERLNLTGVNNIMIFLKKRTFINEIEFY